jgi:hypothetical protein
MVARVKLVAPANGNGTVPVKRKRGNPNMVKGNKLALGNKGPGQSLAIRRERRFITSLLIDKLSRIYRDAKGNKSMRAERMLDAVLKKAEKGDVYAFNSITDRIEGKPTQAHEISGRDGKPITMITAAMSLAEMVRTYQQTRKRDI